MRLQKLFERKSVFFQKEHNNPVFLAKVNKNSDSDDVHMLGPAVQYSPRENGKLACQ